jgi:hypothetical protein
VRMAIEAKSIEPAMDSDEYGDICARAVHPTPSALPGGYNTARLAVLGGHLQAEGVIVVTCALVRAIGRCAVVLSQEMALPPDQAASLLLLGAELESCLGGYTAASMRERIRSFHASSARRGEQEGSPGATPAARLAGPVPRP